MCGQLFLDCPEVTLFTSSPLFVAFYDHQGPILHKVQKPLPRTPQGDPTKYDNLGDIQ